MKIAIASDHAGFELCRRVVDFVKSLGHDVTHFGTHGPESVDYPDFAAKAARSVAAGHAERGVLVCGSGIGMDITANKFRGVRAALCHNAFAAEMSRRHNDANIMCLGARLTTGEEAERLVALFLDTPFEAGRHEKRLKKIGELEAAENGCPGPA
jgi:ribose 5-phosphate isomerase B